MRASLALMMFICLAACQQKSSSRTDKPAVPFVFIESSDPQLKMVNGVVFLSDKPFSGHIAEHYTNGALASDNSFLNGRLHGCSRSYYSDGRPRDLRWYRYNRCNGRHTGWWENGRKKFEFTYADDKKHGTFSQWYKSGSRYTRLNFKDDKEDGMQQAWRENGKIYINYQVKDGYAYGLRKSSLCYTLIKETLAIK